MWWPLIPALGRERQVSLNSRSHWSTVQVPRHPGDIEKQTKTNKKEKRRGGVGQGHVLRPAWAT